MADRRYIARVRRTALAIALGTAGMVEGHPERDLPANAVQPPGATFEGYPHVSRGQKTRIVEEVARSSVAETIHAPLHSAFLMFGRTTERLAVRAREVLPGRFSAGAESTHVAGCVPADLGGDFGGPVLPARLTLLPNSESSVRGLLGLIATAQSRIDLMMYGWEDDPTGREVADALAARARAGVRIRLLVDRTGFLIHNPAAARDEWTFLDALRTVPNVTVIEPPGTFLRFDHRKLAVVDDRIAWSGGMILTEVARRRWHNLAFVAEGPIVTEYALVFAERWEQVGGCPEAIAAAPEVAPNAAVRLIQTDIQERSLKETIYHAVDHARHHIYLENPYFTDEVLTAKLVAARARGVDVRAILTLRGNVRRLNRYETLTANRLLRGGVRVYLYPIMTHVKAMSADGDWAYLGSGNFDELSFRNNREVGLSIMSPGLVGALDRSVFLPDMAASEELRVLLPPPRDRLKLEVFSLWY